MAHGGKNQLVVVVVYLLSRELTIGNYDFICRLFRNAQALKDFDLISSRELIKNKYIQGRHFSWSSHFSFEYCYQ